MSALTDPKGVEFRIIDDEPGSGLTDVEAYELLAGITSSERLGTRPLTASAEQAKRTGGMIALVPTETDAERLTVADGEDAGELHLTLAFLGDDVTTLDSETREKIIATARRYAGDVVDAETFAVNIFNPGKIDSDGSPGGCVVLGVGRSDDLPTLRANIVSALGGLGNFELPPQHEPWIPHITLKYTDDFSEVSSLTDRLGEVTFDRLRVALGPDVIDIPLGKPLVAHGGSSHDQQDHAGDGPRKRDFPALTAGQLTDAWTEQLKTVTPNQELAARYYKTDLGYKELNNLKRHGSSGAGSRDTVQKYADLLQEAMRPSPVDVKVTRGFSVQGLGLGSSPSVDEVMALKGAELVHDGFTSTTTDRKISSKFFLGVMMEIDVPKGTPSLWLDGFSGDQYNESELLLAAGTKIRVTDVESFDHEGQTVYLIKTEVISD